MAYYPNGLKDNSPFRFNHLMFVNFKYMFHILEDCNFNC